MLRNEAFVDDTFKKESSVTLQQALQHNPKILGSGMR
jgi:hypothetical protein